MAHIPRRRNSNRWRHFNYASTRSYGVTLCVQDRRCLLGRVVEGRVQHSAAGLLVDALWRDIPTAFPFVRLDEHVVMPNHVHGILFLAPRAGGEGLAQAGLGDVVRWWKSITTRRYAHGVHTKGWPRFRRRLWQRGFHDRVLRNDEEVAHGRAYIQRNPIMWDLDPNNPERRG